MTSALDEFDLESDVTSLDQLGLPGLRTFWLARWGRPPRLRSAELLRLVIGWRLQAAQFGGRRAPLVG